MLLADTGTGKDITAEAVSTLFSLFQQEYPRFSYYIGPRTYASGQALIKHFNEDRTAFLSVLQEFGITLQEISKPLSTSANSMYRQILLDLYSVSGKHKVLQPFIYSDSTKNTNIIMSPALTLLCEGTKESFYDGLSEDMISTGLIPRFTIIEYSGGRTEFNPHMQKAVLPEWDADKIKTILEFVLRNKDKNRVVDIKFSEEAYAMQTQYNKEIDERINNNYSDVFKQLWNRAHLKAVKLAGLFAVCSDYQHPEISAEQFHFAQVFTNDSIHGVEKRFVKGEFGAGSNRIMADFMLVIQEYKDSSWRKLQKSKYRSKYTSKYLHDNGIISYQYISRMVRNKYSFRRMTGSSGKIIQDLISELERRGELIKVSNQAISKKTGNIAGNYWKITISS